MNLFVDIDPETEEEFPMEAHLGAWLSVQDETGILTVPARTKLGKTLAPHKIENPHQIIQPNTPLLSSFPHERGQVNARIRAMLNLN